MRILHVSLGDPAQHQGGLNRYCRELMQGQARNGHNVMLLYAGSISFAGKPAIATVAPNKYELRNSLPVAITYGIDNPSRYMRKSDISIFQTWLQYVKPDVIHVHSIQGIYLEFFQAARMQNIPIVFTTHDYYPICFRCTLVKNTGELCSGRNPEQCAKCNWNAGLSGAKQILLQSHLYQYIKGSGFISLLRKNAASQAVQDSVSTDIIPEPSAEKIRAFAALGEYYDRILDCFTVIHANSSCTGEVYQCFRPDLQYCTLPITRVGLTRTTHHRRENAPIRFGYMGGMSIHKGYEMFQKVLALLDAAGHTDWEAWYYGGEYALTKQDQQDKRRHYVGVFGPSQEAEIWQNIDVLLAPSVCRETFGFVVLEALCHGIPVICSNLVGSQFLVKSLQENLVVPNDKPGAYMKAMAWLMDDSNYSTVRTRIDSAWLPIDFRKHCKEIYSMYEKCDKAKKL